jgi:hypothetical protein
MTDVTSGVLPPAIPSTDQEAKCPYCGRKQHDTGKYQRDKSERRKALLRDADDPNSGLSDRARKFIKKHNGNLVPSGYEVSHEVPLYTKSKGERCKLDVADNLKTQRRSEHRKRHRPCGQQYHDYPR